MDAEKIPVIVSPPPRSGFNVGACLERKSRGLPIFRSSCDIDYAEALQLHKPIYSGLAEIKSNTGVEVLWLNELLCKDEICRSEIDGQFVYRDSGHLSISGSKRLLGEIGITADSDVK